MGNDYAPVSGKTTGDANICTAHNALGSPDRRLIFGETGELSRRLWAFSDLSFNPRGVDDCKWPCEFRISIEIVLIGISDSFYRY